MLRFNPVLWLAIVTWAPGITAPLGSVMVPKTVPSWVCDQAIDENNANNVADNIDGLYGEQFV
jgi:hypothetical protein